MNKSYSDKLVLKVYNELIEENSKRKLTPEELYVYCLLNINRNLDFEMSMTVNVNLIHYISPIKFVSKENENKLRIRKAVEGLIKKGCLIVSNKVISIGDITNIKNTTFFTAVVNDVMEDRYVQLHFNEFRFFKSAIELYIYIISKKFSNSTADIKGFKGSYNRWAKLLCVSDKTAMEKLEEARKRELINIDYGKHISRNKQSVNIYTHINLMDEKE